MTVPSVTPEEAVVALWHRGVLAYKLRDHQHDLYAFLAEPPGQAKKAVADVSRQYGKSFVAELVGTEACLRRPRTRVSVVAPTAKMLRGISLPAMQTILSDCPPELLPKFNGVDNAFTFTNGSTLSLFGADNGNADSLRGRANDLVIIDEGGFISDLKGLIYDIVLPSFLTTNGRLLVVSTPPKSPGHYYTTLCREAEAGGFYFRRTINDNSSVTPSQRARWCAEAGGPDSSTWRREYLVEHVIDTETAVIPEFHDGLVGPVGPRGHNNALVAMDVGFNDPTAVLFCHYDFSKATLCVEDEVLLSKMRTDVLADHIREAEERLWGSDFTPYTRVSDIDLNVIHDLSSIHGINFTPVEKAPNKELMVNELRMWVKDGRVRIDPRCKNLILQLKTAVWAPSRRVFDRTDSGGHFDAVDALVYAIRSCPVVDNPYPQNVGVHHHTHWVNEGTDGTDGLTDLFPTRFR